MKRNLLSPNKRKGNLVPFLVSVLVCIFCIAQEVTSQTTVYIDPTFAGSPKSGTITNPFTDIPAMVSNTTYLLKGGTTLTTTGSYSATVTNVKIGAYGTGRANVISSYPGNIFLLNGNGNTYENLNVTSTATDQTSSSVLNMKVPGGLEP